MNERYPNLCNTLKERRGNILDTWQELESATLSEIAAAVNLPESSTLHRLRAMVDEGQIKCLDVGDRRLYMPL